MAEILRALKYRNLDEASAALREAGIEAERIFDDQGAEPTGLLSVIPEDRLSEENFYRLFGLRKGTLIEVERIPYSGFGPPAEEADYMGFVSERICYVAAGCGLPVEIEGCPQGARDIHHLEALVLDGMHPLDAPALAGRLKLPADWSFEDLFQMIAEGRITAQQIDQLIHKV